MIISRNKNAKLNFRNGFSLVELMVVVAIIGILAAISAGVVIRFLGGQKNTNTENTVKLLNTALERVLNNLHRRSQQDFNLLPANQKAILELTATNLGAALGVREPARRQLVVYQNIQLFRNFPQTYDEISKNAVSGKTGYPATLKLNYVPSILKKFQEITASEGGDFTQLTTEEVNSALLLMALETNPDGLKREDLGPALVFKSKVPFIVNGSQEPIQFGFKYNQDPSAGATALKGAYSIDFIY